MQSPLSEWKTKELEAYVGGLSKPSKMPGYAYSLPALECITGTELRKIRGSVCFGCYAMKGRYVFPTVQAALYRRLEAIAKPYWPEAMAELILRKTKPSVPYFRWHDSGDLQSVDHFAAILAIARATPTIRHWLPTREYRIVGDYFAAGGELPPNINVRMSAHMLGGKIPTFRKLPVTVSSVSREDAPSEAHRCPAPQQGNACGECRSCWSRDVPLVDYHYH